MEKFPEIERMFGLIGTAEIAVDPMGANLCDTYVELKPRREWRKIDGRPATKEQLIDLMRRELAVHAPGQTYLFTQPIQMRFNEMMAGVRADIAVKVYGDDFKELERISTEIRDLLRKIPGSGDVEFDAFGRSPLLEIKPDRDALRRYNMQAGDLNHAIGTALAGEEGSWPAPWPFPGFMPRRCGRRHTYSSSPKIDDCARRQLWICADGH